jgi:hypothetical protein
VLQFSETYGIFFELCVFVCVCVCMCGFCNVCVCVGFVMCGCVYEWVLFFVFVCMGAFGIVWVGVCVWLGVGVWMCGFCNVWVCECVGFVMCGCVYVSVL